ncbi:DinB family protein [Streptomyces sp. NPDC057638]|uniref:DinB family protein n=1 Tax=Streptomyces sp. NPDC057638 TaxID=3346190 RepID=UPI00368DE490
MTAERHELLRWQAELTWSLCEYHLERLTPEDFLWEPAPLCWTLRQDPSGRWVPDWADTEPDPVPVPTIGWVSWHLGWWLGVATDHLRGDTPRERDDVRWPGEREAVAWLRELRDDWRSASDGLADADLDAAAPPFPWPDGSGHTVAHFLAWANAELMKNVAELGQLRLVRTASSG